MSQSSKTPAPKRLEIGVLYGFRALMVLFVVNYHFWQQSWLGQYAHIFGRNVSFDFWTRSSYVFVDGMILLSGFLLYLPFARNRVERTPVPKTGDFYLRRLTRILPSYLTAVLFALFFIAIPQGLYHSTARMAHDVTAHLTFTFLFWPATYIGTPLNVALWTICVEMQFYLIFPLLARCMRRHPAITLAAMTLAGWTYRFCVSRFAQDTNMLINQLPSFLDVYALGFLGAMIYVRMRLWVQKARKNERLLIGLTGMILFAMGVWVLIRILRVQSSASAAGHAALRLSQMSVRVPLTVTLMVMMLSAAFWPRIVQKLLDNRLMRFLSTISMNLYIWHQVLAVEMRKAWFPNTELLHTDHNLQMAYTLLSYSVAILAAMIMTYGVEQPVQKWIHKIICWRKKHERPSH
ncbi:MAG: acyltransferase [Clostridia bacterium]|nr:acyltransferase [Clostridia bacterium]